MTPSNHQNCHDIIARIFISCSLLKVSSAISHPYSEVDRSSQQNVRLTNACCQWVMNLLWSDQWLTFFSWFHTWGQVSPHIQGLFNKTNLLRYFFKILFSRLLGFQWRQLARNLLVWISDCRKPGFGFECSETYWIFQGRQKSSNLWLGFVKHYFLWNVDFKLPNSHYFQNERSYSNCLLSNFKHILNFYISNMHSSFKNKKTVPDTLLLYCTVITVLGKMILRFRIRTIRQ